MANVHVVKSFRRSIMRDKNICDFSTELSKDFEIKTPEDLVKAEAALFKLAYDATRVDINRVAATGLLAPQDVPPELIAGGLKDEK